MQSALASQSEPTLDSFHAAVDAHGDRWYAACLQITRDAAAARDAVQEGLLAAWSKRSQFHADARLETWIYRITVNAALQSLRKRRLHDDLPVETLRPVDPPTPADAQLTEALGEDLTNALGALSDFERTCFVLKHLEQWRLKEIAAELDTKVSRVKQGVFRGVRKLRSALSQWETPT